MMTIKHLFGLNLGTFEEKEVNLSNIAGVQWDNGAGKGYLKCMVILSLSTRRDFRVQDIVKTTPECSVLLEETNANADTKNRTKEDQYIELNKKLTEIFKHNQGLSSKSFILLEVTDGIRDHSIITYPSKNPKVLNKVHILGDVNSSRDIFNTLVHKINIKDYTVAEAVNELGAEADSLNYTFKIEEENKKSEFIKKASPFYLGNEKAYTHGKNILNGISDRTLSILNTTIVNETVNEIETILLQKDKDEEVTKLDEFKNNNNNLVLAFTDLIEMKDNDPLVFENDVNSLKSLVLNTDLSNLSAFYFTYSEKREDVQNNIQTNRNLIREDQKLILNKRSELTKKEEDFGKKKSYSSNAYASLKRLIIEVNTAQSNIDIPFNEIKPKLDSLEKEKERLEKINTSNLSIEDQKKEKKVLIELKKKEIKDIEDKNKAIGFSIKSLEKLIEDRELILFASERSSEETDFVLELFNIKTKEKIFNQNDIQKIYDIVKINTTDFGTLFIDTHKNMLEERKKFKSEELLREEIIKNTKEIEMNNRSKDLYINDLETLSVDLKNLNSEDSPKDQITKITTDILVLEQANIVLRKINNKDELENRLVNIELSEYFNLKINRSFDLAFSEEVVDMQLNLFLELSDKLESDLSDFKAFILEIKEALAANKIEDELKGKELDKLDSEFASIKDFNNVKEFLVENGIVSSDDINEDILELPLSEIEIEVNTEFDLISRKKDELSHNWGLFQEYIIELGRSYPNNYKEFVSLYLNLITFIESKLSGLNMGKDTVLAVLQHQIMFFEDFTSNIHSEIKSFMRRRSTPICNISCSTGEKYEVKNNLYVELHFQEIAIKKEFDKLFSLGHISDLDDHQINRCIEDADKDTLINIKNILSSFGSNGVDQEFQLDKYIEEKTKNFSLKSTGASTGNSLVLNVGVRQQLLSSNKHFRMTLFIDEFSAIDQKNIDIMFKQELQAPAVFLQNSYSDFDKVRKYLDLMNQNYGERGTFKNRVTWLGEEK